MYRKKAPCTIALIIINVAVFLILSFMGMTEDPEFMMKHGAMYVPSVIEGKEYYRLFTCLFLHFGFSHLMNNMLTFGLLGWQLELELGKIKFLFLYLAGGICGNLLSAWFDIRMQQYSVSAGASGAIFGIIGALFYVAVRNRGTIGNVSGKGIAFMAFLSLYYGFTSTGVDNLAHIGGLVSGFVLAVLLYRKRKSKFRADAGF